MGPSKLAPVLMTALAAGLALIHHVRGEQTVQTEEVLVRDGLGLFGALLDPAETGEVIEDFAAGALGMDGERGPAFERADFLKGEGIALDGGGGVRAALAAVRREPRRPGRPRPPRRVGPRQPDHSPLRRGGIRPSSGQALERDQTWEVGSG